MSGEIKGGAFPHYVDEELVQLQCRLQALLDELQVLLHRIEMVTLEANKPH